MQCSTMIDNFGAATLAAIAEELIARGYRTRLQPKVPGVTSESIHVSCATSMQCADIYWECQEPCSLSIVGPLGPRPFDLADPQSVDKIVEFVIMQFTFCSLVDYDVGCG